MTKAKEYTSDDIQVMSDIEHVRARTQIYLGNTNPTSYEIPILSLDGGFAVQTLEFVPAALRAIYEISDNSVDEFEQNGNPHSALAIDYSPTTGRVMIRDNGRGVPINKHKTGPYTPEVVFGSLRSGRNFTDAKQKGVRGQNGVGSSCVAFTSKVFEINIVRDGMHYHQVFHNGSEQRSEPKITKTTATQTGTAISFTLDPQVFKSTTIPEQMMINIANEIAFNNAKVTVTYTNNDTKQSQVFKYARGLEDLVKKISNNFFKFTDSDGIEFFVIFDKHSGLDEKMFTWVNSVLLLDGGICNTQFMNSFSDIAVASLEKAAKKARCVVTKNDVRQNLLILASLKVSDPEFDAQSKTRLTGPNLKSNIHKMIEDQWNIFSKKNKNWLELVVERARTRHHRRANEDAVKDLSKKVGKVPGLLDATSTDRSKCMVLITEGESASSQIEEVRDPKHVATFAMSGKFNNVYGSSVAEVIGMGKLKNLLLALGLVPGRKANRANLPFGHIVIATDADADGDDIFTLLVNLFYKFWPELMDPTLPPVIYRLTAPNVAMSKGNKRVHFVRKADYEADKHKYPGYTAEYFKGLAGMSKEDWKMVLGNTACRIPITDDGNMGHVMALLFDDDSNPRKKWLQGEPV